MVSRGLLVIALASCDQVERVSFASECGLADRDFVEVELDGRVLCGRAWLSASRDPARRHEPGEVTSDFAVVIAAELIAGDGQRYWLAIGYNERTALHGEHLRGFVDPDPPLRRGDKDAYYASALARLSITHPLELPWTQRADRRWSTPRGGLVELEHYDLTTGRSRGSFEVVFETRRPDDTRRLLRATGTFQTDTPIDDVDHLLR